MTTRIPVLSPYWTWPASTWIFPAEERPVSVALRTRRPPGRTPVGRVHAGPTRGPPRVFTVGPARCQAPLGRAHPGAVFTGGAASGPIRLRTAVWTSASSAGSAASRRSRSTTRASPVSACRAAISRVVSSQSHRHSTAKPAAKEGSVAASARAARPRRWEEAVSR